MTGTFQKGDRFSGYEVVAERGRGGMGIVYEARHLQLGRRVAVKLLKPELSANHQATQRFFNEARAAASIEDAGVVDVLDVGVTDNGEAYLVMEYLEGEALSDIVQGKRHLPEAEVLRIGRQAAATLDTAHKRGIVHRDLKPSNILLVPDAAAIGGDRVKIVDFGIAKLTSEASEWRAITKTGVVLGTPRYMSPEQCRGESTIDGRSDIYSLGCVLYRLACGTAPVESSSLASAVGQHLFESPVLPRELRPELSEGLEKFLLCMLAKDPAARPPDMAAVARGLAALATGEHPAMEDMTGSTGAEATPFPATQYDTTTPDPTTLSGSSAEMVSSVAKPWRPFAVLTGVVAVAAIAFFAVSRWPQAGATAEDTETALTSPKVAATQPKTEQPPASTVGGGGVIKVTPASKEPVELTLKTKPAGARVIDRATGEELGTTPIVAEWPQGTEPLVVNIELDGHQAATARIVPDRTKTKEVVLAPIQPKSAKRRRPPSKSKDPKAESKSGKTPKTNKGDGFGETIDPLAN